MCSLSDAQLAGAVKMPSLPAIYSRLPFIVLSFHRWSSSVGHSW